VTAWFLGLCTIPEAMENCPIACNIKQECFSNNSDALAFWTWDSIQLIKPDPRVGNGTLCLSSDLDPATVVAQCRKWVENTTIMNASRTKVRGVVGESVEVRWDDLRWWPATIEQIASQDLFTVRWDADGQLYNATYDNIRVGYNFPEKEWLEDISESVGTRFNITSCNDLELAIDKSCSFNSEQVESFTRAVISNGGDHTIAFWVKPIEKSLTNGQFIPQAHFTSTISPPQQNYGVGKYSTHLSGEVRMNSACFNNINPDGYTRGHYYENSRLSAASHDSWTLVTFRYRNSSSVFELSAYVNGIETSKSTDSFPFCFYNSSSMFQMIEFNYPMLVSPIMLIPSALPLARIQQIYYSLVHDLEYRTGPIQATDPKINLLKKKFSPRSVLMTAPVVFQTRALPSTQCPYSYSRSWILEQYAQVINSTCRDPFVCSNDVLNRPELTVSCTGDYITNGTEFGLDPMEFQNSVGFADFLYSITDADYTYRVGSVIPTSDFFDSTTQSISLILVFFSPQYGMTSVLTIFADLSGPNPVNMDISLQHYEIVEGPSLLRYIVIQALLLAIVLSLCIDVAFEFNAFYVQQIEGNNSKNVEAAWMIGSPLIIGSLGKCVADFSMIVLVIVAGGFSTWLKINSNETTNRIVGGLASIPWQSSDLPMLDKKR
jgi:hypothetical protein